MDETVTLWIFGTIVGVQVAVMGALIRALWHHVMHCRAIESGIASIDAKLEWIKADIGDHGSGLRGAVHKHRGQIGVLAGQVDEIREKVKMRPLGLSGAFMRDGG